MRCPDGCEPAVYKQAMLPCWHADPAKRLGFAALMETLVDLGAVPSDAGDLTSSATASHAKKKGSDESIVGIRREPSNSSQKSINLRESLGPSVHHIQHVLAPKVFAAVQPPFKAEDGRPVHPPEAATIANAVEAFVKPISADKLCPRDGNKGAAYVDTLTSKDDVGQATALLSCTSSISVSLSHSLSPTSN